MPVRITLVCWIFGLVHPYFYLAIAIVASIVIGYLASFLFPAPGPDQLKGLTVFTGGGRKGREEPAIDTSFLKIFITVIDQGSMAAAARVLNISVSAVAQQLHALERELGAPLVVRVGSTRLRPRQIA